MELNEFSFTLYASQSDSSTSETETGTMDGTISGDATISGVETTDRTIDGITGETADRTTDGTTGTDGRND